MGDIARPLWRGRTLVLLGIALFAFSLRTAVASLSPVIDHIQGDFALPSVVIGLIGTAPPVCFAVFGILTPALERRFGLEALAAVSIAVVAVGLAARGFAGDSVSLLLSTVVLFAAVGVGNVLLPPLVKRYFPDRIGLMTTVYSTAMAFATFLPPLVAVPVADAAGWRVSLGGWAVFAAVAIVPWVALLMREHASAPEAHPDQATPRAFGRMWRLPMAWALMVGFAASGSIAYTSFGWLPVILVDIAGMTPSEAGGLLGVFATLALPSALLVPLLVVRFNAVRLVFGVAIASGLVGLAGLLLVPTTATWVWVILYGLAAPLFPLILTLLGIRARTHEGTVALSGFVQSVGYAIAALFPVGFGLLHELTGQWTIPLGVMVVVMIVAIPAGVVAARPHTVEEEWERRHGAW